MARTTIVHLGDTRPGPDHYWSSVPGDDSATAFERAVDVAVERDVDAVVHTGDRFDDPPPAVSTRTRRADVLDTLCEHDVPCYGIAGKPDRSPDEQWLDPRGPDAVTRLGREPTVVGDTALYGIDAVRPEDWETTEFSLDPPPASVDCAILCMHELLDPPVDEGTAHYPVADVLDRVGIDLCGLALGGSHRPASARVDGTDVWYAGPTARWNADATRGSQSWDDEPGSVQLLEIDGSTITRRRLEVDSRPVRAPTITVDGDDGLPRGQEILERYDLADAIATVDLVLDDGVVAPEQLTQLARDGDVAAVDAGPGFVGPAAEERATEALETAQNAVETAALLGYRRRSERVTASAPGNAAGAIPDDETIQTEELEHDE